MRLKRGFLYCLLASVMMSGCASTIDASKSGTFSNRLTAAQNHWRFNSQVFHGDHIPPAYLGPEGRLQTLLDRLIYVSPLRGYEIKVYAVNDAEINAGTDGKSIFMNAGLLELIWHDEGVIAGILAHELGHILAHHIAGRRGGGPSNLAWNVVSPALGFTKFGTLITTAVREGFMVKQRAYSRYDEKEADAIAAYLTHEAGFDPSALSRFFEKAKQVPDYVSGNVTVPIANYANPQAAMQSAGLFLLRASPFYRTHPASKPRRQTVNLMSEIMQGMITVEQLRKEKPWLAEIYTTLSSRSPKSRPSV